MANKTQTISFRIRRIDTDLTEAIATISKEELAQRCRDGLRLTFGLTTSRASQVIETPIAVPSPRSKEEPTTTKAVPTSRATIGNGVSTLYKPKS